MTHETPSEPTPDEVSFGPASPVGGTENGRARRTGRALTWVAVGAIGATVLTGVAFAATNSESSTPSASAEAPSGAPSGAPGDGTRGGPGRGGPGGHGGGFFGGFRGDVLHGEFVVKDGDSTKTVLSQTGAVTAVSSTELTVKSTDGFTATWTLSSTTTKVHGFGLKQDNKDGALSDIKVGQTVNVSGTKTTSTSGDATQVGIAPTAAQLAELKKNAPDRGNGQGRPGNPEAPAPAPSTTAESSSTGA